MGRLKNDKKEDRELDRSTRESRLRLIDEQEIDVDEESAEFELKTKTSPTCCVITFCGFGLGFLTAMIVTMSILFGTIIFGLSYTTLDAGTCSPKELGIGQLCVSCPLKNASLDEIRDACLNLGAEPAKFGIVKAIIDAVGTFSQEKANDFITVARISESSTTCVRATANGAASIECPRRAAIICQRPRPLGPFQEFIRRTRIKFGLESANLYAKNAVILSDLK